MPGAAVCAWRVSSPSGSSQLPLERGVEGAGMGGREEGSLVPGEQVSFLPSSFSEGPTSARKLASK